MTISLTLRTTILIFLIAFTCSNRCTSHPRLAPRLLHSKSNKIQESPKKNTGYLHSKPPPASRLDNKWTTDAVSIISHITPITRPAAFLANISIGNPPVPQLLLIDTGSDLTWIQYLPCKCYPQSIPFYRPSRSSTYRDASCEFAPHAMPRISHDERTKTCQYYLLYRDNSSTRGTLAEEKLTFQTSDDGLVSKQNIVIGCGQDNSGFTQYSGVLGLGPGKFSIVTRNFGSKFSYCFGSLTDPTNPHNILILGDGARTEGDPTPLRIFQDRYYLDLQAISLGHRLLDIKPDVFERYGSQGGTVIDTGCSPTILAREAYDTLFEEIDFILGDVLTRVKDWDQYTKPCYEGNMKLDLLKFPVVTFHFAGGAELTLDFESLFVESDNGDRFCLALSMNTFDDMSVIGAMAQQHYNVGYDLLTMNVYFQRTDCEILDS
ncbi:Eukaryotic aspartyl protease family protein [Raphanus sativus]|uniref:Aspartyl protease UND n=1 Tax=Raphanus sativus TaxID=3726 RepID=A0A6J0MC42_RAPSA|nr:aspartyl protease UND [Raphanus sativus]KAJ4913576.1 Eukaryotic aspartyl protease family protein [Raphanus sativus]